MSTACGIRVRNAAGILIAALMWTACNAPKPPANASVAPAVDEVVVTPKAMAGFVQAFFAMKSKDGNGFMTVHDATSNTDLQLKLKPMESADFNPVGMGIYYTCVPMQDASGAIYDVDFMSQKTNRGMSFTEAGVHKTPTETRYEWHQTDRGVWEKKPS